MNLTLWLVLAPLAPGLVWSVWSLSRERDLRLALVVCFLAALVGRQLVGGPPAIESLGQWALSPNSAPLLVDFATHLLASLAAIAIGRSIVERNRAEQVHWKSMETLRSIATFFDSPGQPLDEALHKLLSLGCKHLELEIGLISRVAGERYEILALQSKETLRVAQGQCLALDETFCRQTLERNQVLAIENTAASQWDQHPGGATFGVASYLGMPVGRDTGLLGTLCFAGTSPRKRFSGTDKQFLGLMAHWVEHAMAKHEADQTLDELTRRQQVCLELSQRTLRRGGPDLLSESVTRIASALDAPFAALLQVEAGEAIASGEDDVALRIAAGTGWNEGTLGKRVRVASSFLANVHFKGETIVVQDFATEMPGARPSFFDGHPIGAAACVPIADAERQLGVLCVCATEGRSFDREELDFLRLGANLLASALTTGTIGNPALGQAREQGNDPEAATTPEPRAALSPKRVTRRSSITTDRRRLPVDASIRALEATLRDAAGVQLSLDLAASTSEVRMFAYEFERIVWGLVARVSELANGEGELRVETRTVAPNGAGATSESFVTLGLHATRARLDSGAMSDWLDRDEATRHPGSGKHSVANRRLSLPRIRRLLRAMGGDISAHSSEREGTTLVAYLPTLPEKSARDASRKPAPMASSFVAG